MNAPVAWKTNWEETKQHFIDWWKQDGLVLSAGDAFPANPPHARIKDPHCRLDGYGTEECCSDPQLRARIACYGLSQQLYPCDNLPLAGFDLGPGSLAVYLDAKPVFDGTVWYEPWMTDEDPSGYSRLRLNPKQCWYKLYRRILAAGKSVQAVGLKVSEVVPLLDAVGGKGMYLLGVTGISSVAEAEKLLATVKQYR